MKIIFSFIFNFNKFLSYKYNKFNYKFKKPIDFQCNACDPSEKGSGDCHALKQVCNLIYNSNSPFDDVLCTPRKTFINCRAGVDLHISVRIIASRMADETSPGDPALHSSYEICMSRYDTLRPDTIGSFSRPKAEVEQSGSRDSIVQNPTSPTNNGRGDSFDNSNRSWITGFLESFHRNPDHVHLNTSREGHKELPSARMGFDSSLLNRELKARHIQMIAIGGAIGTGLFIGSGSALAIGGPAALIIAFGAIGIMLFCVVHALGELCVMFPIAGKYTHSPPSKSSNVRFLRDLFNPFH